MSRAVTIKYREGRKVATVRADSCHGEIPAHSDTYYCIFALKGQQVARVPRSRLLPGYAKVYEKLFGRPWMDKVRNAERIVLHEYRDWNVALGGLPDDTVTVWGVNCSRDTWVIVAGSGTSKARAILHVLNNDEITRRGDSRTAIKKLFPGKKVSVLQQTTVAVEL